MSRCSRAATFAALSILCFGVSASADTLRCQSVNGNLNCAGSSGVSCQTVNGKKVCVSGHGDVVQSFGGNSVGVHSYDGDAFGGDSLGGSASSDVTGDEDLDDPSALHHRPARHAAKPRPHADWMSIDGD